MAVPAWCWNAIFAISNLFIWFWRGVNGEKMQMHLLRKVERRSDKLAWFDVKWLGEVWYFAVVWLGTVYDAVCSLEEVFPGIPLIRWGLFNLKKCSFFMFEYFGRALVCKTNTDFSCAMNSFPSYKCIESRNWGICGSKWFNLHLNCFFWNWKYTFSFTNSSVGQS